jgi:hypothetical protein
MTATEEVNDDLSPCSDWYNQQSTYTKLMDYIGNYTDCIINWNRVNIESHISKSSRLSISAQERSEHFCNPQSAWGLPEYGHQRRA